MESESLVQTLVPTLFEDELLLAVFKPAGIDAAGLPGRETTGLAELLAEVRGKGEVFHVANRLTRYECGVLLLGKNPEIARHIRAGLRAMRVSQEYLAVARGRMAKPRIRIDPKEGASRGKERRTRSGKSKGESQGSRSPSASSPTQKPPTIVTRMSEGEGRVLLHCHTAVPNTHSLRAQLRSVRLRLLGDGLGGGSGSTRHGIRMSGEARRTACLHLSKVSFFHPGLRRKITISARPPAGFSRVGGTDKGRLGKTSRSPHRRPPAVLVRGTLGAVEPAGEPVHWSNRLETGSTLEQALRAALVRRLPLIVDPQIDSYRLLSGEVEDLKGLVAERFGPVVILHVSVGRAWPDDRMRSRAKPDLPLASLEDVGRWYLGMLGVKAVYVRRVGDTDKDRLQRRSPESHHRPPAVLNHGALGGVEAAGEPVYWSNRLETGSTPGDPLVGKAVPEQIEIVEQGLKLAIRPYDGPAVGLFLDQRENRKRVRSLSKDKDVLNLFAYTCGFSVAAAAGGAGRTVSVDISPKHLEWGRVNFALNGIALENHRFIRSNASDYFKRALRQGQSFDLIVLDPPTFSHSRTRTRTSRPGQDFSVGRDLATVIGGAVSLLRPGGILMVSTNYRRLTKQGLTDRLRAGAAGRRHQVIETPRLPLDFAVDPDHAKTIFARFA